MLLVKPDVGSFARSIPSKAEVIFVIRRNKRMDFRQSDAKRRQKKGPKTTLKLNLYIKVGDHDNNFRLPSTSWACTPLSGTVP